MTDFLLELRSEEIPARMQAGARADLEKLFRAEMQAAGVSVGEVTVWSTPRRLALIARGLPEQTEAVREETKGPRTGAPAQALEGFLRKTGLTQEQLEDRDGTWFAVVEKPGRAVKGTLAEAIPAIVRAFPWPKSMRWGAASLSTESLRWVRPLSGIVAIFGEELVECQVGDIASGYMTLGHRFHCPGPITIGGADDYREKLRACHVIVDHAERQDLIREGAAKAAADAGLTLVEDEGLVIENAGLTEWPVPLLGRFDEAFLDVPPEVIQLTARVNQKYFVAESGGKLANAFVCTANIEAADGGAAIVDGNRKVLAARLSDARFFWEQDRKVPLAEQARKLERITFHEKLGTVADKVERVAKLARWLVEEGIIPPRNGEGDHAQHGGGAQAAGVTSPGPSKPPVPLHQPSACPPPPVGEELANLAEQAARLAKADLVTEMVGEFPELQGLMGGYYARAEGLPDAVADAIRDHYGPQGGVFPRGPVSVAVALADKLDNLNEFFRIDERPTGSRDPFALRRAAIQTVFLVFLEKVPLDFLDIVSQDVFEFIVDRWKVQNRSAGSRADLIDAVTSLRNDSRLLRLGSRMTALEAFLQTEDGANLLAAYKRAANILKKEGWASESPLPEGEGMGAGDATPETRDAPTQPSPSGRALPSETGIPRTGEEDPLALVDDPDLQPVIAAKLTEKKTLSYTPEPAEKDLIEALDAAEPKAAAAVQAEDFEAAMAALASLRAPIDRFFDSVTVNDEDPARRSARLDLLGRFRAAVHEVADFSKIEG